MRVLWIAAAIAIVWCLWALADETPQFHEPVCRVVEIGPGTAAEVELRPRRGGFVEGVTVLADGTIATGVPIDVSTAGPDARYVTTGRSDGEGRVRLGPLPRGD